MNRLCASLSVLLSHLTAPLLQVLDILGFVEVLLQSLILHEIFLRSETNLELLIQAQPLRADE